MSLSHELNSLTNMVHHFDVNMEIVRQYPRIFGGGRIPPSKHGLIELPDPRTEIFHGLVEDLQERPFSKSLFWLSCGAIAGRHYSVFNRCTGKLNVLSCSAENLLVDA